LIRVTDPNQPLPPPVSTPQTATFQDGVAGYSGTRDTVLRGDKVTKNYGDERKASIDGKPDHATIISWDVSSIPQSSIVQSVQIALHVTNKSKESFEVYALTRSWDEGQATWNVASAGNNWSSAGAQGAGDFTGVPIGVLTATKKGVATITLNAAGVAMVQSWVNNPSDNFGIVIQNYVNTDGMDVATREAKKVEQRPKLSITYAAPLPVAPIVENTFSQTGVQTSDSILAGGSGGSMPMALVATPFAPLESSANPYDAALLALLSSSSSQSGGVGETEVFINTVADDENSSATSLDSVFEGI
jgi:hypothetical protein